MLISKRKLAEEQEYLSIKEPFDLSGKVAVVTGVHLALASLVTIS